MPAFSFFNTGREWVKSDNLKNINTVIIYFNTGCEFCQEEIKDIFSINNEFHKKNIQIVFVSLENLSSLQSFETMFAYDTISNWTFAHVSPAQVDTLFRTETVPTIFIYKNGILLEKNIGQLDAEDILDEF
jgi:thiol-disulfide isomerase/thioredoxin